ncbi:TPA: helix-turn-helix domain-containing protein [Salmonella enterica]
MRFKHSAVVLAKKAFLVRLSFIIKRITEIDVTQKEIAQLVGCSASQISAIKNEREKNVTIETLMRVADVLRLTYTVEYQSRNGKCKYIFKMESGVDYMKNCPIRQGETGRLSVVNRKPTVVVH